MGSLSRSRKVESRILLPKPIEFEVTDIDACRKVLQKGGLSPQQHGDLTFVASADAHGVVVAFRPAGMPLA